MIDATARAAEAAVRKARQLLVLDHCFFGCLSLHLRLVADESVLTMVTDGESLIYAPSYVLSLPMPELLGLVAHETLHCGLHHHARRECRDLREWNEDTDYVVNPIVLAAGLKLPPGLLINPAYAGLSAEVIHARRVRRPPPKSGNGGRGPGKPGRGGCGGMFPPSGGPGKPQDGDGQPGDGAPGTDRSDRCGGSHGRAARAADPGRGDGKPGPCPTGTVLDAPTRPDAPTVEDWRTWTAQAAAVARGRGKLPGELARLIEDSTRARVDWRAELRDWASARCRDDYSWSRPDRRHWRGGKGIYLPSLCSPGIVRIGVVVDTSGSISAENLAQFRAELSEITGELGIAVRLVAADSAAHDMGEIEPGGDLPASMPGGGGTAFAPAFALLDRVGDELAGVVYLTDLDGSFPSAEPPWPVLWVTVGTTRRAPWGRVVPIEP